MKYPYLAYKLAGPICSNVEITIVKSEAELSTGPGIKVQWEGETYLRNGKIDSKCREALRAVAKLQSDKSGLRVCMVYSPTECDFIERDGRIIPSNQPPYATLKRADGDYKFDLLCNSGKIDDVQFTKVEDEGRGDKKVSNNAKGIKQILGVLILLSPFCFSSCVIGSAESVRNPLPKSVFSVSSVEFAPPPQTESRRSLPTAICRDGWESFSATRSGTCSHHGGVRIWFNNKNRRRSR